jgi:hypothetical protein
MDNRILIFNDGKNYFPLKATATEKDIIRFLGKGKEFKIIENVKLFCREYRKNYNNLSIYGGKI